MEEITTEVENALTDPPLGSETELFRFKDEAKWKESLADAPEAHLVKDRILGAGKTSSYLSITFVEALADKFFKSWYVTDIDFKQIVNELGVMVKIQALPDFPGADYIDFSGVAAKPITQKAQTSVAEFEKHKYVSVLEAVLPALKSLAITNAFSTIGNVYGRNLGRQIGSRPVPDDFSLIYQREYRKEKREVYQK